ncbi:MAG TPA: hypothetical protein VHW67_02855 [Solirubrobacteraceae bacterium]|nr:hypothetical protein [Solirubrobacteraceae bacterium]
MLKERNRTVCSVSLISWWAPSSPRRKATTSPAASPRRPAGVRSVGRPSSTASSSSSPRCQW